MNKPVLLCLLVLGILAIRPASARNVRVGYAVFNDALSHEDSAAIAWLNHEPSLSARVVRMDAPGSAIPAYDVLWVHLPDSVAYQRYVQCERQRGALKRLVAGTSKLLCTGYGAFLANDLGLEPMRPVVRFDTLQNDWLWDKKGFQSYRGHPLLADLFGGEYVWDARVDQVLPIIGYYGADWPQKSSVVAVEKSYVFMHSDRRIVTETRKGSARIVSIGGLVYFGSDNALRRNLETFMRNALFYVSGTNVTAPASFWTPCDGRVRHFTVTSRQLRPTRMSRFLTAPSSGLCLTRQHPRNDFFDLAGRRALIMGRENGGIDEIWNHPFRVLRDYEAGIIDGDSVAWLRNSPVTIEVRPESFTRTYTLRGGTLREILFTSFDRAGGVVHYEASMPLRLFLRFRSDMRVMWPYDVGALGNLHVARDQGMHAVHVRDSSGMYACVFGADRRPDSLLTGQFGRVEWSAAGLYGTQTAENQIASGATYTLAAGPEGSVSFAFAGTNEGYRIAVADYRYLLEHADEVYAGIAGHYKRLLARSVAITSPDTVFTSLFPWAIIGADRFVARTPGLGTGLLAGFSTVNRGWDGAQRISGRPGYAWYFGRDAAWSGFAFDAYGDCASVRDQLELYQKFQDASGKIYHELSTSGVVHFDASDSTPLYVILAGHYMRASGDAAFIARSWPHLKRAMDFLYATDTDGDGLIENTDVGHGWVEPGGSLFGVHSEFYLSVLWYEALRNAAAMATICGHEALGRQYTADAKNVRRIVDTAFWNTADEYYSYGKKKDGTYTTERTVFPSVGMLYQALDDARARPVLSRLAANEFTTSWGVRILTSLSPHFNPRSYQEGSVWPLMTGWTALGEYTYGNSAQAFAHVMNVLQIKKEWALGFVQEVMHGSVYRPAGVCPHQCWSETNILHPVVEGMIGWKPDAPSSIATLTPRFPVDWDTVSVSNLRMGKTALTMTMKRSLKTTVYRIARSEGPSCTLHFAPEIPASMEVTDVNVNGRRVPFSRERVRGIFKEPIVLSLSQPIIVTLTHSGGVGMIPLVQQPVPGDSAAGVRLIATDSQDGTYLVTVEGKQGTQASLPVRIFDDALPTVQGAGIRWGATPGTALLQVAFTPSTEPTSRTTIRMQLR